MNSNALELEHLKVEIQNNGRTIIDDISFNVPAGKIVALVGESGSGKTMTSMAVMGLLPAGIHKTGGIIRIAGTDYASLNKEDYRAIRNEKVSIVMQNPMSAFDPVLTIRHHFWETIKSHAGSENTDVRETSIAALAEVGFQNPAAILEMYPFQMSGGMLQRVMLAIALLSRPPFLIADEATTDLDVVSQAKILKLLKRHCERNHSAMLLITHDFGVAASLAGGIILMKEGKIIEQNSAERFFSAPKSEYAERLLSYHRMLYTARYTKIMEKLA
ncbi:nickel import ATP-binding protein NikD [Spirochaetia bacterium]|nr:nickel import ATP-binding protein NikD [Spirochaetia bacterium]